MSDRSFELSRRKILGSVSAVGIAGAGAGVGTSALFSDEETIGNNSITAGTLDMSITAKIPEEGVNGEWNSTVDLTPYDETADGEPGVGVMLEDMKPGDWVVICYDITVESNPACLGLKTENTANNDNGLIEPEETAGDTTGGSGEGDLAQNVTVTVYGDLDESNLDGTLAGGENALSNELLGDVTLDEVWNIFGGGGPIATETRSFDFYMLLELPPSVGNVVQSDSVEWDFLFDAVQSRNNECETPVWTGDTPVPETFSISASPDSAGATDSVHRLDIPVGTDLDGTSLSSLTVDYPADFDLGAVDPGDIINAGVERTDDSITPLSVSGTTSSDGNTMIAFTLGGGVSVSTGDSIFLEYRDAANATTADDYTVTLDINTSEIGPGTLTITPESQTPQPTSSTFDEGDDGWEIIGDAQGSSSAPNHEDDIGNPAPSISAVDDVQGGVWYFKAPGKFLADKSGFYGGTLEYDLRQDSDLSNQFSSNDIILEGDGVTLNYDHGDSSTHPPSGSFTSYSVALDESDDWTKDGNPATQSEIQAVLGDLTGLFIRGEYESGSDTGYLDNVSMDP